MYNKHLKIFSATYKSKIENEFESLKKLDDLNIDIGVRQFNTVLYENFIKNNAPKK